MSEEGDGGLALDGTHGSLLSCLSAPSVAGLVEEDPWILAVGKPQESHPNMGTTHQEQGFPPTHASTSKPLWDAEWEI